MRDEAAALDPSDAVALALAAKRTFDTVAAQLDGARRTVLAERDALTADQADIAHQRGQLVQAQEALSDREEAAAAREDALQEADEALAHQEAEAAAGFLARRDEILKPLRSQMHQTLSNLHQQEQELLAELQGKLAQQLRVSEAERDAIREQIAAERRDVADRKVQLRSLEVDLERLQADLSTRETVVAEREHEQATTIAEIREKARREVADELADARSMIERHRARGEELDRASQLVEQFRLEVGDPAGVSSRMIWLDQECRRLQAELNDRPDVAIGEELDATRHRLAVLERERDDATKAQRDLEQQLSYQSAELEGLDQLRKIHEAQSAAVGGLNAEIQRLTELFHQMQGSKPPSQPSPSAKSL